MAQNGNYSKKRKYNTSHHKKCSLRKTGIVTFLSEKGYGFITEDKTKENIFFHSNNCAEPVKKGNKVSYEKEKSPKGFSAAEIQLVK